MPIKVKEIVKLIKKKLGAKPLNCVWEENDHLRALIYYEGFLVARTKFSHGEKELGSNLESLVKTQLKMNTQQYRGFIQCPFGTEGYIEQIAKKQIVPNQK